MSRTLSRILLAGFLLLLLPQAGCSRGSGEPDFDLVYDPGTVVRYELELPPETWEAMLADPLSDTYREGTFRWGEELYESVGVRFKGNSSRWTVANAGGTRYSFKVDFNEYLPEQTFHGLKKLNLHNQMGDPSSMRERLSYDIFRDAQVPASRLAYVELWLNGTYHGLYTSVQQVNKPFLREWFEDDGGNLYKPETGDLTWQGESSEAYASYELKTNEELADYSGLIHFLDVLNNTPDAEFEGAIAEVLDVESALRWLAANTLLVALDSYAGSIAHNFYLYDDPSTGRFVYLPWDLNGSFGSFNCGGLSLEERLRLSIDIPYCTRPMGRPGGTGGSLLDQRPLISRLLEVPAHQQRYRELLGELVEGRMVEGVIDAEIASWEAMISEYVETDPTAFFTYAEFQQSLDTETAGRFGLRAFNRDRNAYVRDSLDDGVYSGARCGDGHCDSGEKDACSADCEPSATDCPACTTFVDRVGRCVPTCATTDPVTGATCDCPTDAPVTLICETVRQVCIPEPPPCDCPSDQVCTPLGTCVPPCVTDADCPPVVPICDPGSGLCHQ